MCNRTLNEGYLPASAKTALVTPLLKKEGLDPVELKNYRPISNLSYISKLIERIVGKQLTCHLDSNNLLPKCQSAYRSFHSTETAVLKVYSDMMDSFDKGHISLLAMLDMSSAFDTVSHHILIERLSHDYGLCEIVLKWFSSYLTDRTQTIKIGEDTSESHTVVRGVPQGSVLGPILFILYTAEIFQIIEDHDLLGHAYADDTQLYLHAKPEEIRSITPQLVKCIDALENWLSSNQLKLNPDKTEIIWFASSRRAAQMPNAADTLALTGVNSTHVVRNLGVYLDAHLTLKDNVTKKVQSCFYYLRPIRQICRMLPAESIKLLLHAFITSRLDYCNAVLINQPDSLINRLQSVQNAAARIYAGVNRFDRVSVSDIMGRDLHWLKIRERIKYKICVMVFNCRNGCAPEYLSDDVTPWFPARAGLRSSDSAEQSNKLVVPATQTKTFGERSFRVAGPSAWNSLPSDIRMTDSKQAFQQLLKTHLFSISYPFL